MKGMIKKDLLMMGNNYKALVVTLLLYLFYSFMFDMDMSFFLPFMGLMTCISTISYDDYNNWHTYAASLPQGRENVVRSKYIITVSIVLVLTVISIGLSYFVNSYKGNPIDIELSSILGIVLAYSFMMSLLYPIELKYGAEKGRIAMIVIGFGIYGIILFISKVITPELPVNLLQFLDKNFPVLIISLSIIMIAISYLFAKKFYVKREF